MICGDGGGGSVQKKEEEETKNSICDCTCVVTSTRGELAVVVPLGNLSSLGG